MRSLLRDWISTLHKRLSERQFLLFSSMVVGVFSGSAAITLKAFVHWIHTLIVNAEGYTQFFVFSFFPIIGITLSILYVRRVLGGDLKKGTAEIVYAIAKRSGIIQAKQIPGSMITSGLTIGFGGSNGLESPLVCTGSAIGSVYSQSFQLSHQHRTILLGCGAAAAIAAAFNSPIAGVLFAVEVLLVDTTITAFIPLIIAAASAALLSKVVLKEGVLLTFSLQQPFDYTNVPYYVVLGLVCGALSVYYVRTYVYVERKMSLITRPYVRGLTGGLLLATMLVFFPTLFGEGYESIKALANLHPDEAIRNSVLLPVIRNEWKLLAFLGGVMIIKSFAAAVTVGGGGNGGSFAPSLFVGGYLGFVFSRSVNILGGNIPESNFILVSMAGILSGIFHAPLTAIFLIAEITGGYGLMIPLMIVSTLSLAFVHYFEPLSMETKRLSEKLKLSIETRDKYLLSKLELSELIETNFSSVSPSGTLRDLVKIISTSSRNIFPVVDGEGQLAGIVRLDDVRDIMFNEKVYDVTTIRSLMREPGAVISTDDDLHTVLRKFDETGDWNLPVTADGRYLGFVSKSNILAKYRTELIRTL